jgi:hypothetical protein
LCVWPFTVIFGTGETEEKWDLEIGFRDLLNERLTEANYNIIEPNRVDEVLQETGRRDFKAIADELNADIMIVGDIKKFQQHRTQASSEGPTKVMSSPETRLVAIGGVGGYFYYASVKTDITLYDGTGEELKEVEVSSGKDLKDFYMGVGPLTYHRGDKKDEKEQSDERKDPIVDYDELDKMKFGTDKFKTRTLFGMATMDVIDQIISEVEEYILPSELKEIQGKIVSVGTGGRLKENQVYINLGAVDGVRIGHKLGVYIEGLRLTDPDTGEELSNLPEEKVGVIQILKVEADHLSIAEIIEKTGEIERGNIVKRE